MYPLTPPHATARRRAATALNQISASNSAESLACLRALVVAAATRTRSLAHVLASVSRHGLLMLRGAALEVLPAILLVLGGGRPLLHQHAPHGLLLAAPGKGKSWGEG